MKNLYIFWVASTLISALLFSCKKDNVSDHDFYGSWEIRPSNYFPGSLINYPAGNGNYIELKPNGTINRYENTNLTSSETFTITQKEITECKSPTNDYLAIKYNSGRYDQIRYHNDTLTISTPPCMYDGGYATYVRIKK